MRESFASAYIDVCAEGCHGLWFDAGELAKLDLVGTGMGPALQRALAQRFQPSDEDRNPLDCPHCEEAMNEVAYELACWVEIDECPGCEGIYLDAGELTRIRGRAPTEAEAARSTARRIRARGRARRKAEADLNRMVTLLLL